MAPGCLFNEQHAAGEHTGQERLVLAHPDVPEMLRRSIEQGLTGEQAADVGGSCAMVRTFTISLVFCLCWSSFDIDGY